MADIGATLREARMRASMDITELEAQTKIRAKYLRALENEEWETLPGPTYVKTFLRTYAEALGLDARVLVEEYKLRYEHLSDIERQPITPSPAATLGRRARTPGPPPRGVVIGAVMIALLAALWALGSAGDEETDVASDGVTAPRDSGGEEKRGSDSSSQRSGGDEKDDEKESKPKEVRLRLEATGPVYVCLADNDGILVRGEELTAGEETDDFEARRFRLVLGNNNADLIINGKRRKVPSSDERILLELTPGRGRQPLRESSAPDCT